MKARVGEAPAERHERNATIERLKVLLWACALTGIALSAAALGYLWLTGAPMPLFLLIAVPVGTMLTCLLAGGLMGLVFFSDGSGHDQAAADEAARHDPDGWRDD